jgi:hypothetical protein
MIPSDELCEDENGEEVYGTTLVITEGLKQMRSDATDESPYMQVLHTFGPAILGVMAWADMEKITGDL